MAVDDRLDLLAQELRFVLKSDQREALESLVWGKGVFFVSYQQALALFNGNNCSLSVGLFSSVSFLLPKHRSLIKQNV